MLPTTNAHWRWSSQGFHQDWPVDTLLSMYSQGKAGVCHRPYCVSSFEPLLWGLRNPPKSKFPVTSQGLTLYAAFGGWQFCVLCERLPSCRGGDSLSCSFFADVNSHPRWPYCSPAPMVLFDMSHLYLLCERGGEKTRWVQLNHQSLQSTYTNNTYACVPSGRTQSPGCSSDGTGQKGLFSSS